MRFIVAAVGQRPPRWVSDAWNEYVRRMPPNLPIELREIPLGHRGKNPDINRAQAEESKRLLGAAPERSRRIALVIEAQPWSTEHLAERMQSWMHEGSDICFMIGGPDGLAPACLDAAEERWSLGPMTLPHALARVILAEQLYRAFSMLSNHPYHRA